MSRPKRRAAWRRVPPSWISTSCPSILIVNMVMAARNSNLSWSISLHLDGVVGANLPARVAPRALGVVDLVFRVRRHRDGIHGAMLRAERAAGAVGGDLILDERGAFSRRTPASKVCVVFLAEISQRRKPRIGRGLARPPQPPRADLKREPLKLVEVRPL